MLQDNPPHGREVTWRQPVVGGEGDRVQPKLAGRALAPHVYVYCLVAVEAVDEEAEGTRDAPRPTVSSDGCDADAIGDGPMTRGTVGLA